MLMQFRTAFLPQFSTRLSGSAKTKASSRIGSQLARIRGAALFELANLAEAFLPARFFADQSAQLPVHREQIYTRERTFWTFLWQAFTPQASCRQAVRKLQNLWLRQRTDAQKGTTPSSATGAYCLARTRLEPGFLDAAHQQLSGQLQRERSSANLWRGRAVKVIDGTGLSMPDTAANQAKFPQNSQQKAGCGFPTLRLVGCFCLHTGAWMHWAISSLKVHEAKLLTKYWQWFKAGDVVLGDRGFCSYATFAALKQRGIDAVMRLHQARKFDFRKGKRLGKDDCLQVWERPQFPNTGTWSREDWQSLPEQIIVRLVRFRIETPGWRGKLIVLATTLEDAEFYTHQDLAGLYLRRWQVELYFRDLKTTMGMDILRCRTPQMVEREITMFAIAYNLVRAVMQRASLLCGIAIEQVSFKGSWDVMAIWQGEFDPGLSTAKRDLLWGQLLAVIASDPLPIRPWRVEPRAVKRRPKSYQLLTSPRHLMKVSESRKH